MVRPGARAWVGPAVLAQSRGSAARLPRVARRAGPDAGRGSGLLHQSFNVAMSRAAVSPPPGAELEVLADRQTRQDLASFRDLDEALPDDPVWRRCREIE